MASVISDDKLSQYNKKIADLDNMNARVAQLKLKQANTPRRKYAADEFQVHRKVSSNYLKMLFIQIFHNFLFDQYQ